MGTRSSVILVSVILVGAALLRLVNLSHWPIFADESIYVRWAQVMRAEPTLRFLPLSDGKQPLFMWLIIPFFKVISDPLLAGRWLSVLSGWGVVVGTGAIGLILFRNWRMAVLSLVLAATVPYLVFFSRLALVDMTLTLFVVWTFVFFALAVTYHRLDLAMVAGFGLGFAWLTKSPALFALMLLPTFVWLAKSYWRLVAYLAAAYVIAFGMYNILRLGPQFHQIALRNSDYVFSVGEVIRRPLDPLVPHLKDSLAFYGYLLTPVGLGLALAGGIADRKNHVRPRLILVAWWLVPIVVQSAMAKQFTARYLLFTVPFAVVLAAHALEHIGQKTAKHWLSFLMAGLVVVPSLGSGYLMSYRREDLPLPAGERSGYLEQWTAGYGLKEVADYLRQAAKTGPVVVGSEGYFGTPFDALQLYLNDVPNVRVIGVGVVIDATSEKLATALVDNQVFLVVNSTRLVADPAALTPPVKLIAQYPKAIRPDGTREYLLFFQVVPATPKT